MTELSAQDRADLESIGIDPDAPEADDAPTPRIVLETWDHLLGDIERSEESGVAPETAVRIVKAWPFLKMQELSTYHRLYHENLKALREYVVNAIIEHPEALKHTGTTEDGLSEDAQENGEIYVELITAWQVEAQQWSLDWDCDDEQSHIQLAAIADAQAFFLGETGIIQHLGSIGLDLTQEQYEAMGEALEAAKAGR